MHNDTAILRVRLPYVLAQFAERCCSSAHTHWPESGVETSIENSSDFTKGAFIMDKHIQVRLFMKVHNSGTAWDDIATY